MMEKVFALVLLCALDEPPFFLAAIFWFVMLYRGRRSDSRDPIALLNLYWFCNIKDDINKKISPFHISEVNLRVCG